MKEHIPLLVMIMIGPMAWAADGPYRERHRPQYHFSPREGWIGDPDGLIRFRDTYHLFWWGHATSGDLVHWQEHPWPMKGDDNSFMYFTGSVVVDEENTGGWSMPDQPSMVAIYTAHDRESGLQSQCLSISTNYMDFHYYDRNPVLNLNSRSFRDPDVFWHEPTSAWIMAITLPDDRIVRFYSSTDLKSWRHLSDFGPVGARATLWETPCLFQMPLDGDDGPLKWVLACSLGPNKMQFFVGDFDGKSFTLDTVDRAYLTRGAGLEGDVWQDFEGASMYEWMASGDAFGSGPSHADTVKGETVSGFLGRGLASSSTGGNEATGSLRSPPFTITKNAINFLVGGGQHHRETCMNLVVSSQVARTSTGQNSERMAWAGWDVSDLVGQEAHLSIVDNHRGAWGHIDIDHIVFSDVLRDVRREHANWIDWGSDFYAARIFRDYDRAGGPVVWIGWMGNWDYANRLPMSWGQGALSIPRELSLVQEGGRYKIRQRPLSALQKLRGVPVDVTMSDVRGEIPVTDFRPSRNTYELIAEFDIGQPGQKVGLELCKGRGNKVSVIYDSATSNVMLDRRKSGNVSFSPHFPNVVSAPVPGSREKVMLHVFVDQSSIEVFVNDGAVVLTSQIFPDPADRGISLVSTGAGAATVRLSAWELRSIWESHSNEAGKWKEASTFRNVGQ